MARKIGNCHVLGNLLACNDFEEDSSSAQGEEIFKRFGTDAFAYLVLAGVGRVRYLVVNGDFEVNVDLAIKVQKTGVQVKGVFERMVEAERQGVVEGGH